MKKLRTTALQMHPLTGYIRKRRSLEPIVLGMHLHWSIPPPLIFQIQPSSTPPTIAIPLNCKLHFFNIISSSELIIKQYELPVNVLRVLKGGCYYLLLKLQL